MITFSSPLSPSFHHPQSYSFMYPPIYPSISQRHSHSSILIIHLSSTRLLS